MFSFERRWVERILSSFVAADRPGLAPPGRGAQYVHTFESMQARARLLARLGFRAALWLIALAPHWLLRGTRSFARLSLDERQALLARTLEHPAHAVREAAFLLKLAACLAVFADEDTRARSGFDGRPNSESPLLRKPSRARGAG